jgi:hypothetical protein
VDFNAAIPWSEVIDMTQQPIDRTQTLSPYSRQELAKEMHALLLTLVD